MINIFKAPLPNLFLSMIPPIDYYSEIQYYAANNRFNNNLK